MRRNDEIQAALVSYLKSKTSITDLLTIGGSSASEIREDQWKGVDFKYPAIRIRLISNVPINPQCNYSQVEISFMVFSEKQSSFEADKIAGIINDILNGHSFTSNGIAFTFTTTNLIPAIAQDETTWRSEVLTRATASG